MPTPYRNYLHLGDVRLTTLSGIDAVAGVLGNVNTTLGGGPYDYAITGGANAADYRIFDSPELSQSANPNRLRRTTPVGGEPRTETIEVTSTDRATGQVYAVNDVAIEIIAPRVKLAQRPLSRTDGPGVVAGDIGVDFGAAPLVAEAEGPYVYDLVQQSSGDYFEVIGQQLKVRRIIGGGPRTLGVLVAVRRAVGGDALATTELAVRVELEEPTSGGTTSGGTTGGGGPSGDGGGVVTIGPVTSTRPTTGIARPGETVGTTPATTLAEAGDGAVLAWDTTTEWRVRQDRDGTQLVRPARAMNLDASVPHLSLLRLLALPGVPRWGDSFDPSLPDLRCVGRDASGIEGHSRSASLSILYSDRAVVNGVSPPSDGWRIELDADLVRDVTSTDALGNSLEVTDLASVSSGVKGLLENIKKLDLGAAMKAITPDSDIVEAEVLRPVRVLSLARTFSPQYDGDTIGRLEALQGSVNASEFRGLGAGRWLCQRVRLGRDAATPDRVAVAIQLATRPGRTWMSVQAWRDKRTGLVPPEVDREAMKAAVVGEYSVERVAGKGFVVWGDYPLADFSAAFADLKF